MQGLCKNLVIHGEEVNYCFDVFLIDFLFFFFQFVEGSFEEYLKRLENPQVCSNLTFF